MNPQLAAVSVGTTATAFLTFLPRPDRLLADERTPSVRVNEFAAVAVSLGVGLALAFASGEPSPFLFAVVASAILCAGVEYLSRAHSEALASANAYAEDRMI